MILARAFAPLFLTLGCWCGLLSPLSWANKQLTTPAPHEVQEHGVAFEEWIRHTFFDGYKPLTYTQKWDIPASANLRYGGIPINPKATKYGTPVGLGDALRQYQVDEPFMLIIGYWEQETPETKRFVKVISPAVSVALWRRLWEPVTLEDIRQLDELVKNKSLPHTEAQRLAQAMKSRPPFSQSQITLNPKIDSKGQRRLQCSLNFEKVFQFLAPDIDLAPEKEPTLFGVVVPTRFSSSPRQFPAKLQGGVK
jgi:hypothetical protein